MSAPNPPDPTPNPVIANPSPLDDLLRRAAAASDDPRVRDWLLRLLAEGEAAEGAPADSRPPTA